MEAFSALDIFVCLFVFLLWGLNRNKKVASAQSTRTNQNKLHFESAW